jgi:hypothetical protein
VSDEVEMFSFRQDKVGFFVTLILIVIAAGTLISTIVLVAVGLATGSWGAFLALKIVLASAWVLCIVTVLTRVGIFRMQMLRAERARQAAQAATETPSNAVVPLPPPGSPPEPPHEGSAGNGSPPLPQSLPHRDRPEPA